MRTTHIIPEIVSKYNRFIKMYNDLLFKNNGLKGCDEIYKWQLLTRFKLDRNVQNKNFADQVADIKFGNLLHHTSVAAISELTVAENHKYNELLEQLFRDEGSINQRIKTFCSEATILYEKCKSNKRYQANQSERCAAALLTFYDPYNYTFFMPTFYENLCESIGLEPHKKGERYEHYLSLIKDISIEIQCSVPVMTVINSETKDYVKSAYLIAQDLVFKLFYQYYDNGFLDEIEQENYKEGGRKTITTIRYERSRTARAECILKKGYKCAVCGFDFAKIYGKIGENYIHIHHIIPVSERQDEYKLNIDRDLVPVCPNCHAMLHREVDGKCLSVEELTKIVEL